MSESRETLSALIGKDVLDAVRRMAQDEGKDMQTVVEEALIEHLGRHGASKGRAHVLRALRESLAKYDPLYERLAK